MSDEKKLDQRDPAFEIPSSIEVDLKVPLKKLASDEILSRLSFHPPTVAEIQQVGDRAKRQGDAAAAIFQMSLLSNDGLTGADIGRMNFLDMQICVEKLQPFLELNPPAAADQD
jgi:hypothetical protein